MSRCPVCQRPLLRTLAVLRLTPDGDILPPQSCECGWQGTAPDPAPPATPSMDESALRALIREEVARQLAEQQDRADRPPRVASPARYRAFGVGRR